MSQLAAYLSGLDWSPLLISLKTGIVATIISFFLGIYAARKVVKAGPRVKAVADGILTLPMVLPPTVAGFFLLLLFSLRRPFGAYLYDRFDFKVVQTWLGCILAATVIAFPLMYRNARAAFEQIDVNLIYAARTLGMPEIKIFWKVVVPAAGPGIASGTVLKNEYDLTENCNGHPGRRLYDSGILGDCDISDCICGHIFTKYHYGKKYETCEQMVGQSGGKRKAAYKICDRW